MKRFILLLAILSSFLFSNTLDEIKSKGEIRIGVFDDQPPFSIQTEDGNFEGFEVDMAKQIGAQILGGDGNIVLVGVHDGSQRISFLQENRVDIILSSFTKTQERSKLVDFAMPYFSVALGALIKSDYPIAKESDLDGKKIVIQEGTTAVNYVKKFTNSKIIVVPTSGDGYRALKNGEADVYLNDNLIVMAYPIIDNDVKVPDTMRNIGKSDYLAPAVSKGNVALRQEIDKAMIKLSKEKFFNKIYNDTFGPFYKNSADPKFFLLEDLYRIYGDLSGYNSILASL
ncbi:MAG: transporter substrate-binding domain-containing protein [Campylobacter sp.]|nr:transporter substrate-binding domain-containing protein [Campylobacter sp.]